MDKIKETQRKLVEEVEIGDTLVVDGQELKLVGKYPVNGEGRGFITENSAGAEIRLARTCGTYMEIL